MHFFFTPLERNLPTTPENVPTVLTNTPYSSHHITPLDLLSRTGNREQPPPPPLNLSLSLSLSLCLSVSLLRLSLPHLQTIIKVQGNSVEGPIGLAVDEDYIYWTEYSRYVPQCTLQRAEKSSPASVVTITLDSWFCRRSADVTFVRTPNAPPRPTKTPTPAPATTAKPATTLPPPLTVVHPTTPKAAPTGGSGTTSLPTVKPQQDSGKQFEKKTWEKTHHWPSFSPCLVAGVC